VGRSLLAIALSVAALGAAAHTQGAEPAVRASSSSAAIDPCDAAARCFNAGTFTAVVIQLSASAMTPGARHQSASINIRFRNVSDKPVILAYRSGSSAALDNFGNGFTRGRPGTHDTSVKGIGMVEGRSVDPQFTLGPGQARSATFGIIRFNAKPPIGDAWNYDVVIEEIEILPGQVVRSARANSISFMNLKAGTFPVASAASGAEAQADSVELANKVIDLFKRAKNKH
jgi:hypothetical protein